jgi:hypothetical protein
MILAIDPGEKLSAYIVLDDDYRIIGFGKEGNDKVLQTVINYYHDKLVIEMIASYGMPVGQEVFETCVWIGRFIQASTCPVELVYRKEVKLNICGNVRAKDSNIIQALKDRFGDKGTKANKGYFYGMKADCWQAMALAVTYLDKQNKGE